MCPCAPEDRRFIERLEFAVSDDLSPIDEHVSDIGGGARVYELADHVASRGRVELVEVDDGDVCLLSHLEGAYLLLET